MSYILDALKKSEKDRQRKSLPDILTVQDFAPKKSARPRHWIYLLAAFLVFNAGILAWWVLSAPTAKRTDHQISKSNTTSPLSADVMTQPPSERINPSPDTVQPLRPQPRHAEADKDSAAIRKIMPVRTERQPDQRVKAEAIQNVRSKIMIDHSGPVGEPKQIAGPAPEQVMQAGESVAVPSEKANLHTDMPDPNRIYSLKDLPPGILKSLPPFSVSAFLYAEHPGSRMVRVNGQIMHEGEDLGAEVRLEEITKDGLVFSYRKFRFYVAAK